MTGNEALRAAAARLRAAGLEGAARDARLLLAHAMGVAQDRLVLCLGGAVDETVRMALDRLIDARVQRQPVSQILGQRLFWGRSFRVTPDVLDPRPETETLVAAALGQPFRRVLDLGTGSGCILISVLADRPGAAGQGVDLSPAALAVAQENAAHHGVEARFAVSDWYAQMTGRFDLIVSNPPYIALAEMAGLAPEVRDWEPHLALTPGGDGLDACRAIAAGAMDHLVPGGRILLEIGPTQGAAVRDLLVAGGLADIRILPDLDGRDRVVEGRAPPMEGGAATSQGA
ncbi:MAG: peptide chain release factor N(5)-glutamine methyltransferase [Gemmobacter sp.]